VTAVQTPVRDDLAELEAGLDALDASAEAPTDRGRRLLSASWPPLVALALLLGVWELAYRRA
jgi:NitT/TauT family transport system permease protein